MMSEASFGPRRIRPKDVEPSRPERENIETVIRMTIGSDSEAKILASLMKAVDPWTRLAKPDPLDRWLSRELGVEGAPVRLPVAGWFSALELLVEAKEARGGWPDAIERRVLDFLRSLMRFTRPDGRVATLDERAIGTEDLRVRWERLAGAFPGSDASRVVDWWFPGRRSKPIAPPRAGWSSTERVLGSLRVDWTTRGDLLAFDQRGGSSATRFELFGSGHPWLAGLWRAPGGDDVKAAAVKPVVWRTSSAADVAEWTFRAGGLRIRRVLVLLHGRRAALLADQVDSLKAPAKIETTIGLPTSDLTVEAVPESRALLLRSATDGKSAQVIPMGLPALPYETDRGRFGFDPERGSLSLSRAATGARAWMPLFVSWNNARHRKPLSWRALTVSENFKVRPPELAQAARVSWGRSETFLIYRSLGPPARRSFLGHTTTARFLVARFTPEGDVDPIVSLE